MTPIEAPSRENVPGMFNRIAPRYDLLNRLLSFRQDERWRKRLAGLLGEGNEQVVLDLATGTADVLVELHATGKIAKGVGIDVSTEMLKLGAVKLKEKLPGADLVLKEGDAMALEEPDDHYDAVTISFGIRNVKDVPTALNEIRRVLKPKGRLLVLECSIPTNPVIKAGYLFYFRYILPAIGSLISGDGSAYRYLNESAETFPYGENFAALMRDAGFSDVQIQPQTLGVATIYVGIAP